MQIHCVTAVITHDFIATAATARSAANLVQPEYFLDPTSDRIKCLVDWFGTMEAGSTIAGTITRVWWAFGANALAAAIASKR